MICFVGPLPPPVHGMTVATENVFTLLLKKGLSVEWAGTRPGASARLLREIATAGRVLRSPARALYIAVNGNMGLIYTLLHSAAGRLSGKRLCLHHHSFRYIMRRDRLMAALVRVAGPSATHVANCPVMGDQLRARYPGIRHVLSYSNVGAVPPELNSSPGTVSTLTLGHLSNLSEAKGVGRAVDAFRLIRAAGMDARLVLAGPTADDFAIQAVARAQEEFPDRITYLGPVSGERKVEFFRSIHVFLFPSRYPTETQGIVNLEALAAGKPVIAFDQCCIAGDIGKDGGRAVSLADDYPQAVLAYLEVFGADPRGASQRARKRFEELLEVHQGEVDRFVDNLCADEEAQEPGGTGA